MNKAVKQNVLDKAKNNRGDFLKNGSIIWLGAEEIEAYILLSKPL